MIVWLASFPRSGNTFLRIVINHLYGLRTSTIYDIDGVAIRLGAHLVGFEERPATLDALRASNRREGVDVTYHRFRIGGHMTAALTGVPGSLRFLSKRLGTTDHRLSATPQIRPRTSRPAQHKRGRGPPRW